MINPKVSVIVPAYNVEHVLADCLNSLLLQTYDNKEVIVVDDGSTDKTADICERFQTNNECIKIIYQKNAGVSAARNTALGHSSGDYIVFVDSDDTVDPQYIEELMTWADYDFVTAGYHEQQPDLSWKTRKFVDAEASECVLKAYPFKYMGKYYFGSPWATLMKKKIIDSVELRFNEDIHSGEDTLFIFQYLQYVRTIKILPLCGYWYHYYPNSLVNTRHRDFWKWKIAVEREIYNFFCPCNDEEKTALLDRIFVVLRNLLREYSTQMSAQELFDLYRHPFFEESIVYRRSNGTLKDKILIFSIQHKNYKIYEMVDYLHCFVEKMKNKLKRILR